MGTEVFTSCGYPEVEGVLLGTATAWAVQRPLQPWNPRHSRHCSSIARALIHYDHYDDTFL